MTDIPDPEAPLGLEVAKSVVATQAKAQLRLALAGVAGAIAGSAFGHRFLPTGLVNDSLLDAVTALIIYGVAGRWQWFRARLIHSRFWTLANDPAVPDDQVRPAN